MTEQQTKKAREFRASLLGSGLFFGALVVTLSPTNLSWQIVEETELFWFNGGLAIGLLFFGILGCIGSLSFPKTLTTLTRCHGTKTLIVASLCFIVAQLYIAFYGGSPINSGFLMGFAGTVASLGVLGLGMLWFLVFRTDSTDNILVNTALGLVVAATIDFAFFFIPTLPSQMICASILLASSSVLLYQAHKTCPNQQTSESSDTPSSEDTRLAQTTSQNSETVHSTIQPSFASFAHAYSNLWLPLAGTMMACFIQGLVWNPVISESSRSSNAFDVFSSTAAGALLVLIAVVITLKVKPGLGALPRFIQIGCPIAIGILLVHPFVSINGGIPGAISTSMGQAAFYATALFVWGSAVASSDNTSLAPLAFFFPCAASLALTYGIGLFLIHAIGVGGKDLCLILLTVFLVLYSFSLMQANQTEKHGRIVDEIRPDQFIHKRCDELAQEFGISPRETEVLYYLGRGYNHGYIARKLFLSENTVRTHVRHIYAKLGISSREDLLNLIDENEVEATEA